MKKSSERLVVTVTPAQKRVIEITAQELGISVSELLRRAVLAFDATSEQVRAARIVDNWRTRRAPDALNETLRRIAAKAVPGRAATSPPPAAHAREASAREPLPVAAAVTQALEGRDEGGENAPCESACLDAQTVARMTERWRTAGDQDADNAPAFDAAAPMPRARRATGF